jgi:CheY-like chemotaxis protein
MAATSQAIDKTRMLIADDDPAIVDLLADRCSKMGFSVETASNGIQALFKVKRNSPDILLVDINMPQLDGMTLCNRLLEPANRSINVIVVTGSNDSDVVDRCAGMGAFFIRKGDEFWSDLSSALAAIFPDMEKTISEQATQNSRTEVHSRPRVLLIDDDPSVEVFLSSRLGKYGVDLLFASDAIEGYRMARREKPSVIISDYDMPNGDAFYLLWRLRTTSETEHVPVFILTGLRLNDGDKSNLRREICGRPGASMIFSKTTDIDKLFVALEDHCGFSKS